MSPKETERDFRYLDTVQQNLHKTNDNIDQIIALVMDKFKFGYGGYNGYIKEYSELKEDIKKEIGYYIIDLKNKEEIL